MHSLQKYSKFTCSKALKTASILPRIPQYCFSQQQQSVKSPEFSNKSNEDTDTTTNPLLKSLSENPTFAQIQDTNPHKRHQSIDTIAYKRKNRSLRTFSETEAFSKILNARSVDEIRTQLEQIKSKKKPTKSRKKQTQNRIMDILESIASDDGANELKSDESDIKEDDAIPQQDNHLKTLRNAYYHAIKVCGYLKEFEEGFKLFEETKQQVHIICPRIFAAAIWLKMEEELSVASMDKCYEWYQEMQNKYNFTPSGIVYAELIKNCTILRQKRRAQQLIDAAMENEQFYINSRQCINAIMNHYAKTKQIEKGLVFMRTLSQKLGSHALDDVLYSTMISGVALVIKDDGKSMIAAAEKLFEQSFNVLGRAPKQPVFGALLHCYAHVPDPRSCIDIVKSMISNEDWPTPNAYTFSACLKSLTQHYNTPLSYDQGWKYVDEILNLMGDWKSDQEFEANYGLLFTLCGGKFVNRSDLDKLYMFYDDFESNGLRLSPSGANSLLMAGIDHYTFEILNDPDNREEIKKDLIKYIDWALLQYKKNNLHLTKYQNDKLQSTLSQIV